MKRWSLRGIHANVTLAALWGAFAAPPAHAHVDVQPRLVERGDVTEIRVELPQLRPGPKPTGLEVEGEGIDVRSSTFQGTRGLETSWIVRLRAEAEPGVVPLVLRAVYADGRSVEVDEELTVVPGAAASGFPWPAVVAGVALAVVFAAVSLRLARRKP